MERLTRAGAAIAASLGSVLRARRRRDRAGLDIGNAHRRACRPGGCSWLLARRRSCSSSSPARRRPALPHSSARWRARCRTFPGRLPPALLAWQGLLAACVWIGTVFAFLFADLWPSAARVPDRVARCFAEPRTAPVIAGIVAVIIASAAWRAASSRVPGGDEPHYLVITQSLLRDGDLLIENNHKNVRLRRVLRWRAATGLQPARTRRPDLLDPRPWARGPCPARPSPSVDTVGWSCS